MCAHTLVRLNSNMGIIMHTHIAPIQMHTHIAPIQMYINIYTSWWTYRHKESLWWLTAVRNMFQVFVSLSVNYYTSSQQIFLNHKITLRAWNQAALLPNNMINKNQENVRFTHLHTSGLTFKINKKIPPPLILQLNTEEHPTDGWRRGRRGVCLTGLSPHCQMRQPHAHFGGH